ncbi:hypothetical protein CBL_07491 [Carabus blaptoides fortunei]
MMNIRYLCKTCELFACERLQVEVGCRTTMSVVVVHFGCRKLTATREEPTSAARSNNISRIRQDLHQKVIDIPHAAVAWHFAIRLPAADLELEHKNWLLAITYHN